MKKKLVADNSSEVLNKDFERTIFRDVDDISSQLYTLPSPLIIGLSKSLLKTMQELSVTLQPTELE